MASACPVGFPLPGSRSSWACPVLVPFLMCPQSRETGLAWAAVVLIRPNLQIGPHGAAPGAAHASATLPSEDRNGRVTGVSAGSSGLGGAAPPHTPVPPVLAPPAQGCLSGGDPAALAEWDQARSRREATGVAVQGGPGKPHLPRCRLTVCLEQKGVSLVLIVLCLPWPTWN